MSQTTEQTPARTTAFVAILLLAASLRLFTLGQQSLWYDEATTRLSTSVPFLSVVPWVHQHEDTPPLYFIILNAWTHLTGRSDVALRLPSALAGIAAVAVLYRVTRRLFADHPSLRDLALLAALLLATSRFHIAYSQEARAYSLMFLFCLLSCDAFVALLRRDSRRRHQITFVLSTAAMLWTHPFSGVVLAAELITLAATLLSRRRDPALRSDLRLWTTLLGATAILFGPWLPRFLELAGSSRGNFGAMNILGPYLQFAGNAPLLLAYALLLAAGIAFAVRARDRRLLLPLLLLLIPASLPVLLALGRGSSFTARYGIPLLAGLYTIAAYTLVTFRRPLRITATTALLLLTIAPLYTDLRHGTTALFKCDVRSAIQHISTQASAGDTWACSDFILAHPARRYLTRSDLTETDPPGLAQNPHPTGRVWFILRTTSAGEIVVPEATALRDLPYQVVGRHPFSGVTLLELTPTTPSTPIMNSLTDPP